MDRLLGRLLYEARWRFRAGQLTRAWLLTGATAWAIRRARQRGPTVVFSEKLEPGYRLEIAELAAPPTRRERRRARRAG